MSNIKDHAHSDQHVMLCHFLYKKSLLSIANPGEPSSSNIRTMLQTLSEDKKDRLRMKFEIAYFVVSSNLAISKYAAICKLETHRGVDINISYVNENAGMTFCKYIAEARSIDLHKTLRDANLFSILMNESTNVGKIDDELFLAQWCDISQKMRTFTLEWIILQLLDLKGVFQCLQSAVQTIGINALNVENCKMLVDLWYCLKTTSQTNDYLCLYRAQTRTRIES